MPFVHWAAYGKTKLRTYMARYGDPIGVGERVSSNLLDLLPVVTAHVVLPLPSYSLKVVEKYIGYKRALPEANGAWSIAKYIHATELADGPGRAAVMDEILAYNQEDLEATWAVYSWLLTHCAPS